MKSNQINFFILPEDLVVIEDVFIKHGVLLIKQPIYELGDIYTNTLQYSIEEKQFNKVYLTTKEFQKNIVIEKVKNQPYYLIDVLASDVVEFTRGGFVFSKNRLERGRFYFIHSYYDNNLSITKSSEFMNWANNIISVVKMDLLMKSKSKSIYYFSQKVVDWMVTNNASVHKSGLYISKTETDNQSYE
ncbi:MAG: hypothetical protein HGA37_09240 [Lentimicrobium sp.]|nr:hypothetical protein [Lentimicrobium sp.]